MSQSCPKKIIAVNRKYFLVVLPPLCLCYPFVTDGAIIYTSIAQNKIIEPMKHWSLCGCGTIVIGKHLAFEETQDEDK